jgi:hypothetical protein
MNPTSIVTNEMALNRATALQTLLANSLLRLVQNYTILQSTNRTQLLAAEAAFSGYSNGGYNTGNWSGPTLGLNPGAILTPEAVFVAPNESLNAPVNITGGWFETSGESPETLLGFNLNPSKQIQTPLDGFPFFFQDYEGLTG